MHRVPRFFPNQFALIRQLCANDVRNASGIKKRFTSSDITTGLPDAFRADISKLSAAIKDAQVAIEEAAKPGSDSHQRDHAVVTSRYALTLYNRLVSRAKVHSVEPSYEATDQNTVSDPLSQPLNGYSTSPPLADPEKSTSPLLADPEKSTPELLSSLPPQTKNNGTGSGNSYYYVPSRKDAEAENIVNSPNPIVRGFGPVISNMKHDLYQSHRQRVWLGWDGWF